MNNKLKIGNLIANRYRICQILGGEGKSGMGIVYVCFDEEHKIISALKSCQDRFLDSHNAKERFKQEALAWIQLKGHPNIVYAYAVYNWTEGLFIVLEYIAQDELGRNTLSDYLKGNIDIKQALVWSLHFCFGMEYAVSRNVTPHRDIKPDNLMITSEGILKITDFGLAKRSVFNKTISSKARFRLFKKEIKTQVMGSPPWMPPEQFEGYSDQRSDIYSFGIILYQMRAGGSLPFLAANSDDFYSLHKNSTVPKISTRLFPIIKKCLNKNPELRYQSFSDLRQDLEKYYRAIINTDPPQPIEEETNICLEHFNIGLSLRNLGFFDEAVKEYKEALKYNHDFVNCYINLGFVLHKKGELDNAIEQYNIAIRKDPKNYKAFINLGAVLIDKGMLDDAIRYLENGLKIEPNDYIARRNLAIVYGRKGLEDRASEEAQKAIFLNPEDTDMRTILADLLYSKGQISYAIKEYLSISKVNPANNEVHMKLGLSFSALKMFNEAQREFEIYIDLEPGVGRGYYLLGQLFRDKGLVNKAIELWKRAIAKEPNFLAAYNDLGVALLKQERFDEASNVLNAGLKINSKDSFLHYNLGCVYLNIELYEKAVKEFKEAIALNCQVEDVRYLLGCALRENGQKNETIKG
jgi:eukaryotic-like serine/threonine-protein kinase